MFKDYRFAMLGGALMTIIINVIIFSSSYGITMLAFVLVPLSGTSLYHLALKTGKIRAYEDGFVPKIVETLVLPALSSILAGLAIQMLITLLLLVYIEILF